MHETSKCKVSGFPIDVLYEGETKIEENNCNEFIKMLRNYKVYEQDDIGIKYHDTEVKLVEEEKKVFRREVLVLQ